METRIIPFKSVDDFELLMSRDQILFMLNRKNICFREEIWDNSDCSVTIDWIVVRADNGINFFFAKDKLFKMYVEFPYNGKLPNGIFVGMNMEEVLHIDKQITFDEWEEEWVSPNGYWLEDNLNDNTVLNISIFIPELLDDEKFEKYNW